MNILTTSVHNFEQLHCSCKTINHNGDDLNNIKKKWKAEICIDFRISFNINYIEWESDVTQYFSMQFNFSMYPNGPYFYQSVYHILAMKIRKVKFCLTLIRRSHSITTTSTKQSQHTLLSFLSKVLLLHEVSWGILYGSMLSIQQSDFYKTSFAPVFKVLIYISVFIT